MRQRADETTGRGDDPTTGSTSSVPQEVSPGPSTSGTTGAAPIRRAPLDENAQLPA